MCATIMLGTLNPKPYRTLQGTLKGALKGTLVGYGVV